MNAPWHWVSNGSMEEDSEEGGFKDKYASLQLVPVDAERKNGRYRYDDCIIAFYVDHYQEGEWKIPNEAQRRLIAKAPEQGAIIVELVEALEAMLRGADLVVAATLDGGPRYPTLMYASGRAQAAIAKAEA